MELSEKYVLNMLSDGGLLLFWDSIFGHDVDGPFVRKTTMT